MHNAGTPTFQMGSFEDNLLLMERPGINKRKNDSALNDASLGLDWLRDPEQAQLEAGENRTRVKRAVS